MQKGLSDNMRRIVLTSVASLMIGAGSLCIYFPFRIAANRYNDMTITYLLETGGYQNTGHFANSLAITIWPSCAFAVFSVATFGWVLLRHRHWVTTLLCIFLCVAFYSMRRLDGFVGFGSSGLYGLTTATTGYDGWIHTQLLSVVLVPPAMIVGIIVGVIVGAKIKKRTNICLKIKSPESTDRH